ncbi:hypothetical protein ACFQJC_15970 [Haloferax namakaokahaiae]|uniref:Uncharacterized protein n=1 Tax=Haloferax namakaokahaiae TaxID=1748331 RepID=A0ABD5ZJ90_9EURY
MPSTHHVLVSFVLALVVAFPPAFVLSPDPTGATPFIAGIVAAGLFSPLWYFYLKQTVSDSAPL